MCGLVAFVGAGSTPDLGSALSLIAHRGPDATGEWRKSVAGKSVYLGHTRLSILDLTHAADQPFSSPSGNSVIAFNGEIYNHHFLRSQLQALGVRFETRSDTEVLVAAYEQYGVNCLEHLNGMFAFVIVDLRKQRVFAARDAFGIKPLYYKVDTADQTIAFASEVRALKALTSSKLVVDRSLLPEFFLNGFLYEPDSGFVGVKKVPPGSYLEMDLASGHFSVSTFSNPLGKIGGDRTIEALLKNELALQVEADVPVGLFFSGGVDSAVVALEAPRSIEALFVDYSAELEHPDRSFARRIADELKLSYREVPHLSERGGVESALEEFAFVARGTEEPISDYTFAATSLISRVARDAGFKVMLSGMGGDELFAGYPRYVAAQAWPLVRSFGRGLRQGLPLLRRRPSWRKKVDRLESFLSANTLAEAYTQLVGYFSFDEVGSLCGAEKLEPFRQKIEALAKPALGLSSLKQAMYLDRFGYLAHNLTVTDRASMLHGLEVRVPFLSNEIAAAAFHTKDSSLMRLGRGKRPLRELLINRLGRKLVERPKVGFNPPLDAKINLMGRATLTRHLTTGVLRDYVNVEPIGKWIAEHFDGQRNHSYRLWQLSYLEFWLREHSA